MPEPMVFTRLHLPRLSAATAGVLLQRLSSSLVVAELWMATLERAREKAPMKRPGMVFVDEVQNYLHLPTPIDDVLATSRSYGVAWHLAHQYRKQLPEKLRSALDVNARSKICFALDPDDARDLAKLAPQLAPDDFQTLAQHHIYARLVAGGTPTGWCSALALPPVPENGAGDVLHEASRRRYGAEPTTITATETVTPERMSSTSSHQKSTTSRSASAPSSSPRCGRASKKPSPTKLGLNSSSANSSKRSSASWP